MLRIGYNIDDSFSINEKEYKINASFDNIIRLMDLSLDDSIPDIFKIDISLTMLLGEIPDIDIYEKQKAITEILKKYLTIKKKEIRDISGDVIDLPIPEQESVFDFKEDSSLIYSAFMQAYGIDLIEQYGKLHWLKFKALLDGLPNETKLSQIISIRSWNEAEERKDYKQLRREMKQRYKLKGNEDG